MSVDLSKGDIVHAAREISPDPLPLIKSIVIPVASFCSQSFYPRQLEYHSGSPCEKRKLNRGGELEVPPGVLVYTIAICVWESGGVELIGDMALDRY